MNLLKASPGAIDKLPPRHLRALAWFLSAAGTSQGWPEPLVDGTLLVTKAKGIYKPAWSAFALSVRETLVGPYSDKSPVFQANGTWTYEYSQEGEVAKPDDVTEADRDAHFTNRGLVACMGERVPVGVLRQIKGKPGVEYRVLGLAWVTKWSKGFFYLRSLSREEAEPFLKISAAQWAKKVT